MNHEQVVEVARCVRQNERHNDEWDEEIRVSFRQRSAGHLAAATGDEKQSEDVLAQEVKRVIELLVRAKLKADKQTQERQRQAGPGGSPIPERIALD